MQPNKVAVRNYLFPIQEFFCRKVIVKKCHFDIVSVKFIVVTVKKLKYNLFGQMSSEILLRIPLTVSLADALYPLVEQVI